MSTKIVAIVFVSILCCASLLGLLTYNSGRVQLELSLKNSLEKIAGTASLFIDGDIHGSITSVDTQAYGEIQDALIRVRETNDISAPIYTLIRSEGRNEVECVITTEPVDLMGAKYKMRDETRLTFKKGIVTSTDIYKTRNGSWISAYAPIKNSLGAIVAVIKIQHSAGFINVVINARIIAIVVFCLIAFAVGLLLSLLFINQITANIARLTDATLRLEKGDYDSKVSISSNDEIGQLALTLDNMRVSLKNKINELKEMWLKEKEAHLESILTLSKAIEIRDPYTRGHIERVSHYSMLIAKKIGISNEKVEELRYGCVLHDLGKLGINISLLEKPAKLDFDERSKMKMHTIYGAEILKGVDFLDVAREISLYHHERYDGKGYPHSLKGDKIPIFARIVSLADAFDAMVTDRPYRKRLTDEKTFSIIASEAGKQFDPKICHAFLEIKDDILKIREKYK